MVQKTEHRVEIDLGSSKWSAFMFQPSESQPNYQIMIESSVSGDGMDIIYKILSYSDYELYRDWKKNPTTPKTDDEGNVVKDFNGYPILIQKSVPNIKPFFEMKTNQIEKTFEFEPGVYALIFDNTYSVINSKDISLHTIESWDHPPSIKIVEHGMKQ